MRKQMTDNDDGQRKLPHRAAERGFPTMEAAATGLRRAFRVTFRYLYRAAAQGRRRRCVV